MEKVKNYIRINLFFIMVAVAAVIYLARGFVTIVETGKSVLQIVADGALGATFAFLVGKLLSMQGMVKGSLNEQVLATNRLHAEAVDAITPYIDKLDVWCNLRNAEVAKVERIKLLSLAGISIAEYDQDCYTVVVDGAKHTVDYSHLPRHKKRVVRRAKKLHLTPLSSSTLTTDGGKANDPYDFGPDRASYMRRRDAKQIAGKVVCGICFGYFGVQLITDFSWAALIWTALQVAVYLTMGAIAYLQAYTFVVDVDRHRVIRKIDNLQKFKVWSEQHEQERTQMA